MKNLVTVVRRKVTITAEFDDKELEVLNLALQEFTVSLAKRDGQKHLLAIGMCCALKEAETKISERLKSGVNWKNRANLRNDQTPTSLPDRLE